MTHSRKQYKILIPLLSLSLLSFLTVLILGIRQIPSFASSKLPAVFIKITMMQKRKGRTVRYLREGGEGIFLSAGYFFARGYTGFFF